MPAALLAAGLFFSFFYQINIEAISGVWPVLFSLACFASLFVNRSSWSNDGLTWLMALWFVYITLYGFIYNPLTGSGYFWFMLSVPAIFYFSTTGGKIDIRPCFAVLLLFALFACFQFFEPSRGLSYYNRRVSWPVCDPNNFACLMNVGLITSIGYFKHKASLIRALLIIPFAIALVATQSTAGYVAAAAALTVLLIPNGWLILPLGIFGLLFDDVRNGLSSRFPIWEKTIEIIREVPDGVGIGNFATAYNLVRTETETSGFYAHNDLLQFGAEMGIFAPIIFIAILIYIALKTTKQNLIPACVILAITIQAMVEFQFYFPAVAMLTAITFNQWRHYGR